MNGVDLDEFNVDTLNIKRELRIPLKRCNKLFNKE